MEDHGVSRQGEISGHTYWMEDYENDQRDINVRIEKTSMEEDVLWSDARNMSWDKEERTRLSMRMVWAIGKEGRYERHVGLLIRETKFF